MKARVRTEQPSRFSFLAWPNSTFESKSGVRLRAGMVVTVEPGVYVPPDPVFPAQYHNMGIRIEVCGCFFALTLHSRFV
jgi:Xaa-Pro aminopeptidase